MSEHSEHKNHFTPNSKYFTIVVYALLFIIGTIVIYKFIGNLDTTISFLGKVIHILSPFLVGAFIAFILYPLVKFLYAKCFMGICHIKSKKIAKWLSILVAYIIAIGAFAILIIFVAPQIYTSITDISVQFPIWFESAQKFIIELEQNHPDWAKFLDYEQINNYIQSALPSILNYTTTALSNIIPAIVMTSMAIVKGIISFLISIIISVYMIADHKNLFYQFKRLMYALIPKKVVDSSLKIIHESGSIFTSFIFGKALDSLIIGIICFVLMIIFNFPYAVLISVIVGVTNMIPYFGPYVGGAVGFMFILITNPIKALFFAILILVIQQFDGLFLGPKILGDKTGLKPLWVIFSITVGGSLFGVLGMFLGVPCVAVLNYILNIIIEHLLKKKNLNIPPYDSNHHI